MSTFELRSHDPPPGAWTHYPRSADARLAAELDQEAEADRAGYAARVAADAAPVPEMEAVSLYPAFGDDPARWGLLPEAPTTETEAEKAAEAEAWGGRGPSASYAVWRAEGRTEPEPEPEPEAEL